MKTYKVSTIEGINPCILHSRRTEDGNFYSTDLDEARKVYEEEVRKIAEYYTHINDLPYDPTDEEVYRDGIRVELSWFDEDKWGEADSADSIEWSDLYFDYNPQN